MAHLSWPEGDAASQTLDRRAPIRLRHEGCRAAPNGGIDAAAGGGHKLFTYRVQYRTWRPTARVTTSHVAHRRGRNGSLGPRSSARFFKFQFACCTVYTTVDLSHRQTDHQCPNSNRTDPKGLVHQNWPPRRLGGLQGAWMPIHILGVHFGWRRRNSVHRLPRVAW